MNNLKKIELLENDGNIKIRVSGALSPIYTQMGVTIIWP
jgi:hypothetical protein